MCFSSKELHGVTRLQQYIAESTDQFLNSLPLDSMMTAGVEITTTILANSAPENALPAAGLNTLISLVKSGFSAKVYPKNSGLQPFFEYRPI